MSEIVYREVVEQRPNISDQRYGIIPTDHAVTIFKSGDKVARVESRLMMGSNPSSDKHYWFWRSTESAGFFRNRAGNIQPYHCNRNTNAKARWVFSMPSQSLGWLSPGDLSPSHDVARDIVNDVFKISSLGDLYPIADMYGLRAYQYIPFQLRTAMREETWGEYATKVFGKNRTTDRLVSAVQNTEPFVVALAHQFRGLVDDETLVRFMDKTQFDDDMIDNFRPSSPWVRPVVSQLMPRSRKTVLNSGLTIEDISHIARASSTAMWHAKPNAHRGAWADSRRNDLIANIKRGRPKTWEDLASLT
jgi:hypothetical protein